jgi:hypothetical protein
MAVALRADRRTIQQIRKRQQMKRVIKKPEWPAGIPVEATMRAEFERQHAGRDLRRHPLRGTYWSAPIAALWNQHIRTAVFMAARDAFDRAASSMNDLAAALSPLADQVKDGAK